MDRTYKEDKIEKISGEEHQEQSTKNDVWSINNTTKTDNKNIASNQNAEAQEISCIAKSYGETAKRQYEHRIQEFSYQVLRLNGILLE